MESQRECLGRADDEKRRVMPFAFDPRERLNRVISGRPPRHSENVIFRPDHRTWECPECVDSVEKHRSISGLHEIIPSSNQ